MNSIKPLKWSSINKTKLAAVCTTKHLQEGSQHSVYISRDTLRSVGYHERQAVLPKHSSIKKLKKLSIEQIWKIVCGLHTQRESIDHRAFWLDTSLLWFITPIILVKTFGRFHGWRDHVVDPRPWWSGTKRMVYVLNFKLKIHSMSLRNCIKPNVSFSTFKSYAYM